MHHTSEKEAYGYARMVVLAVLDNFFTDKPVVVQLPLIYSIYWNNPVFPALLTPPKIKKNSCAKRCNSKRATYTIRCVYFVG